jgi:hypothetical protein
VNGIKEGDEAGEKQRGTTCGMTIQLAEIEQGTSTQYIQGCGWRWGIAWVTAEGFLFYLWCGFMCSEPYSKGGFAA